MKRKSRIIAAILAVIMLLGVFPENVFAKDKRKKISEVKITANPKLEDLAVLGKTASSPTFTLEEGNPADVNYGMCGWLKKNGTKWEEYTGAFTKGTYKYRLEICIAGDAAKTHVFDENGVTVTIDNEEWGKFRPYIDTTNSTSTVWAISKEFEAKDPRIPISNIVAKSDIDTIPKYGEKVKAPKFTVTEGAPARFAVEYGRWMKRGSTSWVDYNGATFTEGTYSYYVQVRIDGGAGTTHVLDRNGITATVDGIKWNNTNIPDITNSYSSVNVASKKYVIKVTNPVKPTVQGSTEFVYDESEKQVKLSGFDANIMELSGDVKKTDAGDYTLYVKSKTGKWSDGSTGNLAIDWKIKKANIEGIITYTTVHRDGNTLRDILINKGFTFNKNNVEGTVSWIDESSAELPYDTIINYNQIYTWRFEPNNKNLNPKTGQARLYPYKEFVVSFDENGHGYAPREQIVRDGNKAKEPSALTDENFDFGGWFTEAECKNEFDFSKPVTSDIKLYAKWTKKTPPTPTSPDKPKAQKPKRFVYDGTEKQVTLIGFDEATMDLSGDIKKTDVGIYTLFVTPKTGTWSDGTTEDVEIEWEIMRANIEGNITHTTVVKDGSTLGDIIVNTNFTFNGNKVEGTVSWINESFAKLPDDTIISYKQQYQWIFKPNNKNLNQSTGQVVLYPYKEFVVSFDTNGHGTAIADQTVREGKQATEPTALTDDDFDFGGWYTDAECTNKFDFTQAVNASITLYAKWTAKTPPAPTQYTLTASVDGGHGTVDPTNVTKNDGETVTLTFAPDPGYELDEVKVNDVVTPVSGNSLTLTMDGDKTVLVKYKATPTPPPTPVTYTLTASVDGGHGNVDPTSKTVAKDETVTLTFTPETGYEIEEVKVNDVVTPVSENTLTLTMDGDKTVVVKYKATTPTPPPTPVTYTLTASVEGGHGTIDPTTKTVAKDDTVTLTFTPDAGYELDTVTVNGTAVGVMSNVLDITMNENKTVVVKFKAVGTPPIGTPVTITFDKNGGTGTMANVTKNKGELFTLPACGFTPPAGKEFKAWQVDGTEKNVGDNIEVNGDKIIKAVWKDIGSVPPTPPVPPTPYTPYPWIVYPGWYYNFEAPKPKEEKPAIKMEMDWKLELIVGVSTINREINGVDSKIKMDVAPYIRDGRIMLPIRYVAEALGFDVEWNRSTRTVVLRNSSTRVEIPVDTNKIIVNGNVYTSDVKPEIKNNRTMLPIANIARALGLKDGKDIIWNSKSKMVTIYRSILVK